MGIIRKIRIKLGLYNLEEEGVKWVAKNLGSGYIQEFREKYETLASGRAIGGIIETALFLGMIERIKQDIEEEAGK